MRASIRVLATLSLLAILTAGGCATRPKVLGGTPVDVGVKAPYEARVVADGLANPSCVTFTPGGALTICDSGNGKVLVLGAAEIDEQGGERAGEFRTVASGFDTEHWKVDAKSGTARFRLGPLSATWLSETRIAVTDAGKPDGEETVVFLSTLGTSSTNAVGPTSTDPADKGEGNLTGMSALTEDGRIFVCGQGADAKTWLLVCDVEGETLAPFASADDAGLSVNSPMQALLTRDGGVLVLYSGAGGKVDGMIAEWDAANGTLRAKWTLPTLVNPMGMAFVPGTDELAVVGNNWDLETVKPGQLARVSLPKGGGAAKVTVIGTKLQGPVSCAFGPDGRLYVAELGKEFDSVFGRVIAISGF